MSALSQLGVASLALLLIGGCSSSTPMKTSFEVLIDAEDRAKQPLEGVELVWKNAVVATTGPTGRVGLHVTGRAGEVRSLEVRCPAGYLSPEQPVAIKLLDFEGDARLSYRTACLPERQQVVVVVRAENGPNLSITQLGREVGRTDGAGAALLSWELPAGEEFELTLGSREVQPALSPVDPSASFVVQHSDALYVFDQVFTVTEEKKRASSAKPQGPERL